MFISITPLVTLSEFCFFFKEVTYVRDTKTRIMSLMASLKKIRVLPEKIVKGLPVYPAFSIIR
jgi:hypothetical protein